MLERLDLICCIYLENFISVSLRKYLISLLCKYFKLSITTYLYVYILVELFDYLQLCSITILSILTCKVSFTKMLYLYSITIYIYIYILAAFLPIISGRDDYPVMYGGDRPIRDCHPQFR